MEKINTIKRITGMFLFSGLILLSCIGNSMAAPAGLDINLMGYDKNTSGHITANTKAVALTASVTNNTPNTYNEVILTPTAVHLFNFPQNALTDAASQLEMPESGGGYSLYNGIPFSPSSIHEYSVAENWASVTLQHVVTSHSIVATVDFKVQLWNAGNNTNTPNTTYTTEVQQVIYTV